MAGTVFTYERTGFGQERVFALGPTTVPVHVEVRMSSQVENIIVLADCTHVITDLPECRRSVCIPHAINVSHSTRKFSNDDAPLRRSMNKGP